MTSRTNETTNAILWIINNNKKLKRKIRLCIKFNYDDDDNSRNGKKLCNNLHKIKKERKNRRKF